jgi:AcrR family transcriptional regulator
MDRPTALPTPQQAPLDANAWVEAAFDELAEGGIDAVRVDPLAKKLGVTRGSFYWHFKDRAALYEAMLRRWRSRATYQVFNRFERDKRNVDSPATRLAWLLMLPRSSPRAMHAAAVELAIRLWARRDEAAAQAVATIDRARLRYCERVLRDAGIPQKDACARAYLFYAALNARAFVDADGRYALPEDFVEKLLTP